LILNGISSFADAIIIATANSNRHAKSLSEKLVESIKASGKSILGVEGKIESGWILVDCGEVVINIMKSDIRDFYDLRGSLGRKYAAKKF
jgi:ribosome-associated protein